MVIRICEPVQIMQLTAGRI